MAAGVQPIHLDPQEALLQRRHRSLLHALLDQAERLAVDAEQLLREPQVPGRGEHLSGLQANLGAQPPLPVGDLGLLQLQLTLGHCDASFLATIQVERHDHTDHDVAVRPRHVLLPGQLEHRVGAQAGLPEAASGGVDLGPRRAKLQVIGERARDQLVDDHISSG